MSTTEEQHLQRIDELETRIIKLESQLHISEPSGITVKQALLRLLSVYDESEAIPFNLHKGLHVILHTDNLYWMKELVRRIENSESEGM